MFQDRTEGHAMGQVQKHGLFRKVLSAAQFAADPPYRHFISQVFVTDEAPPAVNSHANRHHCQPIRGLQQPYQLLRTSETPDLPFLTANTIKGNICPDVVQFFSFPQTEDIEIKKERESVLVFQQKESPTHFSCNIRHVLNSWFNNR